MNLSQKFKREYRSWIVIKSACLDKDNKKYPLYGAKGITFAKEWEKFEEFIKDMGEMPDDCNGMVLADKAKGYNKFNASWGKVKPGMAKSKKGTVKPKRAVVKDSFSFCLTMNGDHYAYIKRQAIMRSNQTGEIVSVNDLIREALVKAYPYAGQYDMFGGKK